MKARPDGRSPEGIYGLIGNVDEYLHGGDPKDNSYFNCAPAFSAEGSRMDWPS